MVLTETRTTLRRIGIALRIVVFLLALGLLILFISANAEEVAVDLLLWERTMRLSWALLITGVLGFLLGALLARGRRPIV